MGVYPLTPLTAVNFFIMKTYSQVLADLLARKDVEPGLLRSVMLVKDTLTAASAIVDEIFSDKFEPEARDRNRLVLTVNDMITDSDYLGEILLKEDEEGLLIDDDDDSVQT